MSRLFRSRTASCALLLALLPAASGCAGWGTESPLVPMTGLGPPEQWEPEVEATVETRETGDSLE
jgi:hypothetical protein